MSDIPDDNWSERDNRNAENAPLGFPPGLPAQIELIGRMMMGAIKRFWNKINPAYLTGGTGDNYVVTPEAETIFINLYEIVRVRIDRTNTTATPTLKFGRTNARTIVKIGTTGTSPLVAGDLLAGRDHSFWYDGTNYILSNPATVDASVVTGVLKTANNLSELTGTAATARTNIGLGNVDNTSDANKPVSAAQASAINSAIVTAEAYTDAGLLLKLSLSGGTMSGDIDLTGHALNNAGDGVGDYLKGLITTRASATQVSVAAGQIKGNSRFVKNTATVAKNINATWAAGTGVGGMESGFTVAANLTYHLHALRKISDGSFDWIYSPNTTITTMPSGYEWVGRFWSVYTNASSQVFDYTQIDNTCLMAAVQWFSTTSALAFAVSTVPAAVPLPGGIRTKALLTLSVQVNTVTCVLTVTDGDDATGGSGSGVSCQGSNTAGASNAASRGLSKTNTTRQLGRAVGGASSGAAASIGGWEDYTLPRVA